ncbi:helix-turn-helix domain-containing protein [Sulfobacillus harzensis]|uniref:helix-turn-helix domain-containing protein n=1 Tax=Sulfobacillus harzensis TaxID=2729629 RepID=UPI001A9BEAB7
MIVAHKIALDPNNRQETYVRQAAGVARFAYNWALAEWQAQYGRMESRSHATPALGSRLAASPQHDQRRPIPVDAGRDQKRAPDGH